MTSARRPWSRCGVGTLGTVISRDANLALAALPGFILPRDTSASRRYYDVDLTPPFELTDGTLPVPDSGGIGVQPLPGCWRSLMPPARGGSARRRRFSLFC